MVAMTPIKKGFTLIEVLVVMAIVATLLSLALPRYWNTYQKSREAALKHDLSAVRDAIDKFYADTGQYPDDLAELVNKKYLRSYPEDPVTESPETWIILPPPPEEKGTVFDIRSGAMGLSSDGSDYRNW
jgi:general secretion pathway protein G